MKLLVYLFFIFSAYSHAGSVSHAGTFTIDSIRIIDGSDMVYVATNESITEKGAGCTSVDYLVISDAATSYDQIYSALLSAAAMSKPIDVWVSSESGDCLNNQQRIVIVEVNF